MNNGKNAAYPVPHIIDGNWMINPPSNYCGLTKRELFAAIAMQGLCANPETYAAESNASEDEIARWSVQQADALLAELERPA